MRIGCLLSLCKFGVVGIIILIYFISGHLACLSCGLSHSLHHIALLHLLSFSLSLSLSGITEDIPLIYNGTDIGEWVVPHSLVSNGASLTFNVSRNYVVREREGGGRRERGRERERGGGVGGRGEMEEERRWSKREREEGRDKIREVNPPFYPGS